jgi:hypothetical protein
MVQGRSKAEMLEHTPASELAYWAALFDIHAQEIKDATAH